MSYEKPYERLEIQINHNNDSKYLYTPVGNPVAVGLKSLPNVDRVYVGQSFFVFVKDDGCFGALYGGVLPPKLRTIIRNGGASQPGTATFIRDILRGWRRMEPERHSIIALDLRKYLQSVDSEYASPERALLNYIEGRTHYVLSRAYILTRRVLRQGRPAREFLDGLMERHNE